MCRRSWTRFAVSSRTGSLSRDPRTLTNRPKPLCLSGFGQVQPRLSEAASFKLLTLSTLFCARRSGKHVVIPWDRISPNQSHFSVISLTGLPGAATIGGIVEISAFISSCNSFLYAASRMLYGLASTEQAPQLLQRVSRHNIPSLAIYITSLCVIAGALLSYCISNTIFPMP
jgi:amino acid transporter